MTATRSLRIELAAPHPDDVIDDELRDVHACRLDTVSELHRIVDLVRQQSILRFEKIHGHDSAADGGGNVGPNLADESYKNIKRPVDIYEAIANGIPPSGTTRQSLAWPYCYWN